MREWDNAVAGTSCADMDTGGTKQKGIVHWGLSANRQNPFANAGHDAVFNTFRRTKAQIFYWLPALLSGYYLMSWATER
jgi:ubiquinol-cytochrome c reductase subunit 8